MKNSLIQHALEKENKDFFFPRLMHLDLLKNCPQIIPTLAQWIYDQWHTYDSSLTKEKLMYSFSSRLNKDTIPITFVILKDSKPIGMISLKRQTDPEFSDFPENTLWIGSFQVAVEERNQGLGQELLKFACIIARHLDYDKLYFYTSNQANVSWYLKRGAKVIEERPFRSHKVTIMQLSLATHLKILQ